MGDMFRSETMALCQIFLQPDAAYATVSELGEKACVQFRDLNTEVSAFQRKFVAEVRRCNELERKLHYIQSEITKDEIAMRTIVDDLPRAPNPREIIELEMYLEKTETEILEFAQNKVNLSSNLVELTEMRKVLENMNSFFSEQEIHNIESNVLGTAGQDRGQLGFVAGVINRQRVFAFERMLWRISRGNVFLRRTDLDEPLKDPNTGHPIYKTVFVAFFQGENLKIRVKKICVGFHASLYPCTSSPSEREEMLKGVCTRLEDLKVVLGQSEDHRRTILTTVAKDLPEWAIKIKKMKAVYHTLNMFNIDVTEKCLIGEGWLPTRDMPIVQQALSDGSSAAGSTVPSFINVIDTNEQPPTYNRTNKFTRGFQTLINAYGVGTYREVNPALYTCITFPFLFAVMFGDLGHGFILFLFGFWMVLYEEKLSKWRAGEIWMILFAGRYIIMLLGLFACYTGFTYNDIFSKSLNVFGSHWRIRYNRTTVLTNPTLQLNPTTAAYDTYPWGIDPIWSLSQNEIIFTNSFKMKLSIIIGILHMSLGICLSVVNFVHFKRFYSIILEFVPQILFLALFFGYMVFMMFFKWVKYDAASSDLADTPGCAPSVLILFINMVLFKSTPAPKGCDAYLFKAQPSLEKVFVVLALLCIPWMLLGKPLYIMFTRKHQEKSKSNGNLVTNMELADSTDLSQPAVSHNQAGGGEHNHDEEPISDVFIHQAIHTIEYVLSTISHTASYLRLWALSLAHAELSQVLWNMVLQKSLHFKDYTGIIAVYIIFAAWAVLTIAIMIMMEGLSAFLHTLRLHWVEFMSKFYEGQGYAFAPFSFKEILAEEED